MGFSIERQGDRLLVRIVDPASDHREVFERMCACRNSSWWSCASGECVKIGDCETRSEGGEAVLALTPRPGESLSAAGVEECLQYVLAAAAGGSACQSAGGD